MVDIVDINLPLTEDLVPVYVDGDNIVFKTKALAETPISESQVVLLASSCFKNGKKFSAKFCTFLYHNKDLILFGVTLLMDLNNSVLADEPANKNRRNHQESNQKMVPENNAAKANKGVNGFPQGALVPYDPANKIQFKFGRQEEYAKLKKIQDRSLIQEIRSGRTNLPGKNYSALPIEEVAGALVTLIGSAVGGILVVSKKIITKTPKSLIIVVCTTGICYALIKASKAALKRYKGSIDVNFGIAVNKTMNEIFLVHQNLSSFPVGRVLLSIPKLTYLILVLQAHLFHLTDLVLDRSLRRSGSNMGFGLLIIIIGYDFVFLVNEVGPIFLPRLCIRFLAAKDQYGHFAIQKVIGCVMKTFLKLHSDHHPMPPENYPFP